MGDIITLPSQRGVTVSHYEEIRSYTAPDDEAEFRIVLASEAERPGVIHVVLLGHSCIEVLETFRDTEAGHAAAKMVGEAADKALFYSVFYSREA